jgi:hypothetical protein
MAGRAVASLSLFLLQILLLAAAKSLRCKEAAGVLLQIRCTFSKPAPEQGKRGRSCPVFRIDAAATLGLIYV